MFLSQIRENKLTAVRPERDKSCQIKHSPFHQNISCISVRGNIVQSPVSILNRQSKRHKASREWAPQGKKKKSPDKEVIHSQPVEEVAMDTAGGRHARQRRWEMKSISASERKKRVKERRGGFRARPTLFPFVCVCAVFPMSVCVEGVLLPLLAAELVEALGMTMSKDESGGCCMKS